MSSLILPRRFASQPNEFCRPSDQIRDAVALAPVVGLGSLATQTVAGDLVKSASQNGIATTFASGQYVDVSHGYIGTDYTIVAVGDFTHAGGQRHVIDNDNFSSERVFQLRLVSYNLQFIPFDASGNPSTLTLITDNFATTNSSAPRVIVARAGGGRVALNATHLGSTSATISSHRAMVGYTRIGNSVGSTSYPNTDKTLAYAIIPRYLPDRLVDSIISDPWQLFRAKPRVLFFPTAGGGATDLTIQSADHAHTADTPGLSTDWLMTVADAAHAHMADGVVLTAEHVLAVAEALHAHAADNVTLALSGAENLMIADALHAHAADAPALSTDWLLTVADAAHAHAADNVTLDTSNAAILTVQDAGHAHAADALALSLDTWLAIADGVHAHLADNIVLTTAETLAILEAMHAHAADNVVLSFPGATTLTAADLAAIAAIVWAHADAVSAHAKLDDILTRVTC